MEISKNAIEKNKLRLLCILKYHGRRLSDNQLLKIFNELGLMDYFDLNNGLSDLTAAGLTELSEALNGVFYKITPIGDSTYDYFKKQIPFSEREQMRVYIEEHGDELVMESRIFSEYMQIGENQFRVILKLLENNLPSFEINLIANTKEEAELFIKAWRRNATEIYQSTLSGLIKLPEE